MQSKHEIKTYQDRLSGRARPFIGSDLESYQEYLSAFEQETPQFQQQVFKESPTLDKWLILINFFCMKTRGSSSNPSIEDHIKIRDVMLGWINGESGWLGESEPFCDQNRHLGTCKTITGIKINTGDILNICNLLFHDERLKTSMQANQSLTQLLKAVIGKYNMFLCSAALLKSLFPDTVHDGSPTGKDIYDCEVLRSCTLATLRQFAKDTKFMRINASWQPDGFKFQNAITDTLNYLKADQIKNLQDVANLGSLNPSNECIERLVEELFNAGKYSECLELASYASKLSAASVAIINEVFDALSKSEVSSSLEDYLESIIKHRLFSDACPLSISQKQLLIGNCYKAFSDYVHAYQYYQNIIDQPNSEKLLVDEAYFEIAHLLFTGKIEFEIKRTPSSYKINMIPGMPDIKPSREKILWRALEAFEFLEACDARKATEFAAHLRYIINTAGEDDPNGTADDFNDAGRRRYIEYRTQKEFGKLGDDEVRYRKELEAAKDAKIALLEAALTKAGLPIPSLAPAAAVVPADDETTGKDHTSFFRPPGGL